MLSLLRYPDDSLQFLKKIASVIINHEIIAIEWKRSKHVEKILNIKVILYLDAILKLKIIKKNNKNIAMLSNIVYINPEIHKDSKVSW